MCELASFFILGDEVSTEDSARLLEWCHPAGTDEFSLSIVEVENAGKERVMTIEQELAAFERDPAPREGLMWEQMTPDRLVLSYSGRRLFLALGLENVPEEDLREVLRELSYIDDLFPIRGAGESNP